LPFVGRPIHAADDLLVDHIGLAPSLSTTSAMPIPRERVRRSARAPWLLTSPTAFSKYSGVKFGRTGGLGRPSLPQRVDADQRHQIPPPYATRRLDRTGNDYNGVTKNVNWGVESPPFLSILFLFFFLFFSSLSLFLLSLTLEVGPKF